MTLMLQVPEELEQLIRDRAQAAGLDVATFVMNAVNHEIVRDKVSEFRPRLTREEFRKRLQHAIEMHPISGHWVDDSHESIYAGRGE